LRPGHAHGSCQSTDHLQDVGELAGKVFSGSFLCLAGLFSELGQERHPVARIIQDSRDRVMSVRLDDLGEPVTDQLVVADWHAQERSAVSCTRLKPEASLLTAGQQRNRGTPRHDLTVTSAEGSHRRAKVGFAERLLEVIDSGRRTATYKLALLLALLDLCARRSDEHGRAPGLLHTREIAEQVAAIYWPQVMPYRLPGSGSAVELRQITLPPGGHLGRGEHAPANRRSRRGYIAAPGKPAAD
jgi:hypothetical protein